MAASKAHLRKYRSITTSLNAALRTRGVVTGTQKARLAEEVGLTYSALWSFSTGKSIPSPHSVKVLADALVWPALIEVSDRLRTRECLLCGGKFIDTTNEGKRIYCQESCRQTNQTRLTRENRRATKQEHITITKKLLQRHRDAVEAFCRACAPESICGDPQCDLRPVSMMPLPRGQQWAEVRARMNRKEDVA